MVQQAKHWTTLELNFIILDMDPQSFFVPISSKEEKDRIFRDVVVNKAELKLKPLASDGDIFVVEPTVIEDDSYDLTCKVRGTASVGPKDDEVIVKFSLGETLYMGQAKFRQMYGVFYLDTRGKLFRVQRRDSFRVKLPASFQGKVRIDAVEDRIFKKSFSLMDLSGGGCRFEAPLAGLELKSDQTWKGALLMPGKPELAVGGVLKHFAPHPIAKDKVWIGTGFAGISPATTNRIEGLVMDLYRTFFAPLAK